MINEITFQEKQEFANYCEMFYGEGQLYANRDFATREQIMEAINIYLMRGDEKFFIDGRISLGYANSQHKITGLGDSSLKFSDDHLYWGTMAGLGWQINETASLMLYYMLDGHGKSDLYGSQLYSNTGLRLGIDF